MRRILVLPKADTWADMQMSNENIAGLQAVLSLNFNYLHVVVAANGSGLLWREKAALVACCAASHNMC